MRLVDLISSNQSRSDQAERRRRGVNGLWSELHRAILFRQGALYVDKILRGTKPEELPFEQPTFIKLVLARPDACQ